MLRLQDLYKEVEQLPVSEKWQLVRHVLQSLEEERGVSGPGRGWQERLRALHGVLADDPLERPPQLPLEEREPVE